MIFFGILAALFADSWWEGREAQERERSYIADLAEDFTENETRLLAAIARADTIKDAAFELLGMRAADEGTGFDVDSLANLLRTLGGLPTFEPVTKTYDNVLGAGDLLTLRDPELRSRLADFNSRLLLMTVVQQTQERQYVSIFQPYIVANLDYVAMARLASGQERLPPPEHTDALVEALGTREFRNWLVVRLDWADDLQDQHGIVLEGVRRVQAVLPP